MVEVPKYLSPNSIRTHLFVLSHLVFWDTLKFLSKWCFKLSFVVMSHTLGF